MRALVTGANGYVGQHLVRHLLASGAKVTCATRNRESIPSDAQWLLYRLDDAGFEVPEGVTHVFHLALETLSAEREAEQHAVAMAALRRLLDSGGPRLSLVFASSHVAREGAATGYARSKWACEQLVRERGGTIVRLGMVYGGNPAGLYRKLDALSAWLPAIPRFVPAPQVYPVHVEEVAEALTRAGNPVHAGKTFSVGAVSGVPFYLFIGGIRRIRHSKSALFVPVPTRLIATLLPCLPAQLRQNPSLVQLQSLLTLPAMQSANDTAELGLELEDWQCRLTRESAEERLVRDISALLEYVLGVCPSTSLTERASAFFRVRPELHPNLPPFLARNPDCLGILEYAYSGQARNSHREVLRCVTALAESSPEGARRFLGSPGGCGFFTSLIGPVLAVLAETMVMLAGLVLKPFLFFCTRRRD